MQDNFHPAGVDDRCGIRRAEEFLYCLGPNCGAYVLDPFGAHRALAQDQPVARPRHRDVQHPRGLGLFLVLDRGAVDIEQRIGQPVVARADRIADEQAVLGCHYDTLVVGVRSAPEVRDDHGGELEALGLMDRHQAHDVVGLAGDLCLRLARHLLH